MDGTTQPLATRTQLINRLVFFSVGSGSLLGAVAYSIGTPFYAHLPLILGFLFSLAIGAGIGLICSPAAVFALANRDHEVGRPIVLWCAAVITGVAAFVLPEDQFLALVGVAAAGFVASCLLAGAILPKIWDTLGLCRRCGYDVTGSVQFNRCPECGTRFDEDILLLSRRKRSAKAAQESWLAQLAYVLMRWPSLPLVVLVLSLLVPRTIGDVRRAYRERSILNIISNAVATNDTFDLSGATFFDWDYVYIFGPYTSNATITKSLGFASPGFKNRVRWVDDGENLLVFVSDRQIVAWALLQRRYIRYPDDAIPTWLKGFDAPCRERAIRRADARFKIVESTSDSLKIVLDPSRQPESSTAP